MGKAVTLYITITVSDLPKYEDHTLVCFSRYLPCVMRLFGENFESLLRLITVEALSKAGSLALLKEAVSGQPYLWIRH